MRHKKLVVFLVGIGWAIESTLVTVGGSLFSGDLTSIPTQIVAALLRDSKSFDNTFNIFVTVFGASWLTWIIFFACTVFLSSLITIPLVYVAFSLLSKISSVNYKK